MESFRWSLWLEGCAIDSSSSHVSFTSSIKPSVEDIFLFDETKYRVNMNTIWQAEMLSPEQVEEKKYSKSLYDLHIEIVECIRNMRSPYLNGLYMRRAKFSSRLYISGADIVTWIADYFQLNRSLALRLGQCFQIYKKVFELYSKNSSPSPSKIPQTPTSDDSKPSSTNFSKLNSASLLVDDSSIYFHFGTKKKIICLGGGFAGTILCSKLEQQLPVEDYQIILIDKKPAFECVLSFPILFRNPEHYKKIQSEYSTFLKRTTVLQDEVLQVEEHSILCKENGKLDFDYLVCATGSKSYIPFPISGETKTIINAYQSYDILSKQPLLSSAKTIAILGAGAVAIEVLTELLAQNVQRKYYIFTQSEHVLERLCKDAHYNVMKHLAKYGDQVQVLFCSKIQRLQDGIVFFQRTTPDPSLSGTMELQIKADAIVMCCGFKPNSEYMQEKFSHALTENGSIHVNDQFRVYKSAYTRYYHNIFACGDVASIKEEKLAQNAQKHAQFIVKNIIKTEQQQPSIKSKSPRTSPQQQEDQAYLLSYQTQSRFIIVSLGPNRALLVQDQKVKMDNALISKVKSLVEKKTMFQRS